MKNKLFICFILVSTVCYSCQEEPTYSCMPEVNEIVKENLSEIRTMTRAQWLKIEGHELQRGCYAAFIPEQKFDFWYEKMQEVLNLEWNMEERKHLEALIKYITDTPQIFDTNCKESLMNEWLKFVYCWQDIAKNKLNWSPIVLYGIGLSGQRMINTQGELELAPSIQATTRLAPGVERTCTCSSRQDFCDPTGEFQQKCRTDGAFECNVNPKNCGWFWGFDCDGNCGHLWVN